MPRVVNSNAREGYICVGAIVCGHPAGELETMACVFIECSFRLNTTGPEEGGMCCVECGMCWWGSKYQMHIYSPQLWTEPPVC